MGDVDCRSPPTARTFANATVFFCMSAKSLPELNEGSSKFKPLEEKYPPRFCTAGGQNVLLAGSELFLCTADLQRQIRWFTGHPVSHHFKVKLKS